MMKKMSQFFKKSFRFSQLLPNYKTSQPIWNDWSQENAIKHGYKASTYVFACINAIAKASASVPWKAYRKKADGTWEEVEGHPLEQLINQPNQFNSKKDFMERMTTSLYLSGNAYFTKVRANGIVAELWNLPSDAMKVVPSKEDFISHYLYDRGGIKERIEPQDIIHNMFTNPANPYMGMSPLQAGAKAVDTDVEAVSWNKVALQNRAITDGVFTFDTPLTKDQWDEARSMVREQHQGQENARTPWVLGAGAKWQQMSLSPAEMDFIESRRFTRSEICSIFQVPPPIVGVYDDATLANIETARKIFWLDTIIPYLEDIKSCLNLSLAPEFGDDIMLDYDVSNVDAIQTNYKEKISNAKELWSMGVPFNSINQRLELGFDEVEGGDNGYLPTNLMPADFDFDELGANISGQTTEEEEEEEEDGGTPQKGQKRPNLRRKKKTNSRTAEHQKANQKALKGLNLKTPEHKEFYWKNFERRRSGWYVAATRKSAQLFKEEGAKVAEQIERGKFDRATDIIDGNKETWEKWLKSTWRSIVEEVGKETFDNLKSAAGPNETKADEEEVVDAFNPYAATIENYIATTAAEKVVLVSDSTKRNIRGIIGKLREDGATLDEISKAIKSQYNDFSRYRAYRIARTEVVGASNYASIKSAEQSGVVAEKEWVDSGDDRVRESHEDVNGERVPLNEKFSNGLQFPADYSAHKPQETIQCRCAVVYHD